jgi:hypothetical protein
MPDFPIDPELRVHSLRTPVWRHALGSCLAPLGGFVCRGGNHANDARMHLT